MAKFYYIPKHAIMFPWTRIIEADSLEAAEQALIDLLGSHNGRVESHYLFKETDFVKKTYEGLIRVK